MSAETQTPKTRSQVVDEIKVNITEVLYSTRANTILTRKKPDGPEAVRTYLEVGEDGKEYYYEEQGITGYQVNQEGSSVPITQRIAVKYEKTGGDDRMADTEVSARILSPIHKDWKEAEAYPDINQRIKLYYLGRIMAEDIESYYILRNGTVDLADGKKGAEVVVKKQDGTIEMELVSFDSAGTFKIAIVDGAPKVIIDPDVSADKQGVWSVPLIDLSEVSNI